MKAQLFMLVVIVSFIIALIGLSIVIILTFSAKSGSVCWGGMLSELESIQKGFNEMSNVGDSALVFVNLESCIEGLVFINKDQINRAFGETKELATLKDEMGCFENYDAHIVAIPRTKEAPAGLMDAMGDFARYDNTDKTREWAESFLREKTNIKLKPICKNVPVKKAVFDRISPHEIPNLGGKFCITLRRLEELKYGVISFEQVTSKKQCTPPET